ncbi:MAG: thioredoxin domain-containing protein [Steroidobacteraceae bacterium]
MNPSTHDSGAAANRLARETSPYLRQHAHNPVDWHPWGPEALELARRTDRPILLSIGYSACHWCHVMAHESFADPTTAALMNELFVNIKLDREERPDLDKIYQLAHQMLTQRGGGWPLTTFLSPEDQKPFFGGTYFPREPRHGLPAFTDLLRRVAEFYRTHRAEIRTQNEALMAAFAELQAAPVSTEPLDAAPLDRARQMLAQEFDGQYGGFGGAPKFPHPTNIEVLLRRWRATAGTEEPDLHSLYMATLTLTRMAEGGLYDQLAGGFCRYSVDPYWMIPHFEKMLYDNGQLLALYAQAALATGDALFARIARETTDWLLREMRSPEGMFWSALDADSEGHEGKFYVWDQNSVRTALDAGEFAVFAPRFGLDQPANFEGQWHLHGYRAVDEIAAERGTTAEAVNQLLNTARHKLLAIRERRQRPGLDDKVLTSWNALAIGGLAHTARALGYADARSAALAASDGLRRSVWQGNRLLAAYKEGRARFPAYLDDHAFLLDALLESLQLQWRNEDLDWAVALAELLLAHFEDREQGGFFFTADDHEQLVHRSKSYADEALPSGNGIAARALLRLGFLLAEPKYIDAAERCLRGAWSYIERYPQAHGSLLIALEEYLQPPQVVIIRGPEQECGEWQAALNKVYAPRRLIFAIPSPTPDLPAALATKAPRAGTVAYLCEGPTCSEPIQSLSALISLTRI